MKEILDDILKAENEARDMVNEARKRADRILRDTEADLGKKKQKLAAETRKLIADRVGKVRDARDLETVEADLLVRCGVNEEEYRKTGERIEALICGTACGE